MLKKWVVGVLAMAIISLGGMSTVLADHGDAAKNCGDFTSGEEVYEFWTSHDYSAENDPEGLDGNDNDGRPCESLTENMVERFATYESGVSGTKVEPSEDTPGAEDGSEEEGDELPVTATSYPTMMLFGLLAAGAGALVLFRRKATQA